MRDILEQIEAAAGAHRLYYVALFGALAIPDIAGALDSENGYATGARYAVWFDEWVGPKYGVGDAEPFLTGVDCYQFRCRMLHQGMATTPQAESVKRVFFIEPGATTNTFHRNRINDALNIDVSVFCKDICDSARSWLTKVEGTQLYAKNSASFVRRHPGGLPPYLVGVTVIA